MSFGKLGAWFLLMILSYTLVAAVSGAKPPKAKTGDATSPDPVEA